MNSVVNVPDSTTNAKDYCVSKAIPDGSNLYYATLFEKPENKSRIIVFHAFLNELTEIIHECSDPGVARIKLKWWQEEIERLSNHQCRHPVTRQLQESITINDNLKSTFDSVIDFFNHFIFIEQADSLDTILSLFKSTSGEVWYQCRKDITEYEQSNLELQRELGALVQYVVSLQQPYTYINETRCIIPASTIENNELQKLLVEKNGRQNKQKEIFSPLILGLKSRLENVLSMFKEKPDGIHYDIIMTKLMLKTCDEILADNCNILDRNITLTPLRKLWIAWLTRTFN